MMKLINLLLVLLLCNSIATAQPDSISIGHNKTTSLIFPLMIQSVDRGTPDILVQKVTGMENILQVKAARENFNATNLTVITADGHLYSFVIHYSDNPTLCFQIDNRPSILEQIAGQKKTVPGIKDTKYEMRLQLKGIYIESDILYYQVELQNYSNISYDIDMLRFYIKDKKQSKRTATQELDQKPLCVYGNAVSVPGQAKQVIVVGLPKCTIPDKKLLCIQLMEKNGGRNLSLKVKNRKIIKAKRCRIYE